MTIDGITTLIEEVKALIDIFLLSVVQYFDIHIHFVSFLWRGEPIIEHLVITIDSLVFLIVGRRSRVCFYSISGYLCLATQDNLRETHVRFSNFSNSKELF